MILLSIWAVAASLVAAASLIAFNKLSKHFNKLNKHFWDLSKTFEEMCTTFDVLDAAYASLVDQHHKATIRETELALKCAELSFQLEAERENKIYYGTKWNVK